MRISMPASLLPKAVRSRNWVATQAPGLDATAFRTSVANHLRRGDLILVIVVDQITPELERTIEFLNECGGGRFSFHALEMRRYGLSGTEILVPHLHGVAASAEPTPATEPWTESRFFEVASAKAPEVFDVLRNLFSWTQRTADDARFGKGLVNGTYTFFVRHAARLVPLFYIETTGILYFVCKSWQAFPHDLTVQFHHRLTAVPGLEDVPLNFAKWPSKKLAVFSNRPEALEQFKRVVNDFQGDVRTAAPAPRLSTEPQGSAKDGE
jgi:hypothetical protein